MSNILNEIELKEEELKNLKNLVSSFISLSKDSHLESMVRDSSCPDSLLRAIGTYDYKELDFDVYDAIVSNENCSSNTLEAMINTNNIYPKISIAKSYNTPFYILAELSKLDNPNIKKALLNNENYEKNVSGLSNLNKIVKDFEDKTANGLAENEFFLANYNTDENIEIFKSIDEAKETSVDGKVHKCNLNLNLVYKDDSGWNYEDKYDLFESEPVEITSGDENKSESKKIRRNK